MTNKLKNKIAIILCGAMFHLISCQNDAIQEALENKKPTEIISEEITYTTKVSTDDAKKVANLFNGTNNESRALKVIKDINVMADDNGKPFMYIVNFANNQGYVLVSATRNFFPVLAYNNEGNFIVPKESVNGLNIWIKKTKQNIEIADILPVDLTAKFRSEWKKYEEQYLYSSRKSRTANSELDQHVIQITNQWYRDGVEWCPLEDAQNFLPTSQYQTWCELAAGAIDYSYQDVNPLTYSFVVTEHTDYGSGNVNNFIHTNWYQDGIYNDRIQTEYGKNYRAGCTTIAMAQIMKYHEYPATFNWSTMGNNTSTIADFIYDVAETINVTYGEKSTRASIDKVKNALISYGYSTSVREISHDVGLVRNELDNRRPVFMQGKSTEDVHAWLASGYNITHSQTVYKLYVPVQNASIGFPYVNIEDYLGNQMNSVYFYMNWGEGLFNGFYNDYNLGDYSAANPYNYNFAFNENRKDLINIIPGN